MKKRYIFVCLLCFCSIFLSCDFSEKSNAQKSKDELTIQGTPAIAEISQKIENEPNNPDLYVMRGQLFYEEGQYLATVSDLTQAIDLDSTNFAYHHLLADAYFDSNQSKPALAILEKVIKKDSTRINTLLKLAEMQMILRQHEASLLNVNKILQQKSRHPEGFYLAGLNFEQTGDTARAIISFQTTVEEDPDHLDAYLKLGGHFDKQDKPIALKYYDNALRIDSTDVSALMGKAWYFHQRSKFTKAKKHYEKAAAFHPFDSRIHFNNGILHLEIKDAETAYKKFDLAVQVDKQLGKGYYYRAYAGERIGKDKADIINDYQQAVAFMPDPTAARKALQRLEKQ